MLGWRSVYVVPERVSFKSHIMVHIEHFSSFDAAFTRFLPPYYPQRITSSRSKHTHPFRRLLIRCTQIDNLHILKPSKVQVIRLDNEIMELFVEEALAGLTQEQRVSRVSRTSSMRLDHYSYQLGHSNAGMDEISSGVSNQDGG